MRVATWNVNSIKQRLENLLAWLAERQPDIVCLQETKSIDEAFPREPLEALGYNVAVHGQKAFNGVAILSKLPFEEVTARLPGDSGDDHARFLEAVVSIDRGVLRVASIYLPNGNPPEGEKYAYKLDWMDRLIRYARERLALEEPLVLAGDYNVIPAELDARNPAAWAGDALFLPRTREKFRTLRRPRADRRAACRQRRRWPLHVLGLPGRCLAKEQRHPHRSYSAVSTGRRSAGQGRYRSACAGVGKTVGSRSGRGRAGAGAQTDRARVSKSDAERRRRRKAGCRIYPKWAIRAGP